MIGDKLKAIVVLIVGLVFLLGLVGISDYLPTTTTLSPYFPFPLFAFFFLMLFIMLFVKIKKLWK